MNKYKFTFRKKVFNALGLSILTFILGVSVFSIVIQPFFSRWPTELLHPVLNIVGAIVGLLLVWIGSRNFLSVKAEQLDGTLSQYLLYRIFKRITVPIWKVAASILAIAFLFWTGRELFDDRSKTFDQPEQPPTGWDLHPKHWHDKDPPPPFS